VRFVRREGVEIRAQLCERLLEVLANAGPRERLAVDRVGFLRELEADGICVERA
jgi:hypothetical protein